jgi:glycosyltransferase involved in cell wall biosynthesis
MNTKVKYSERLKNIRMNDSRKDIVQLTREWPPGYGGIERVVHELASYLEAPVFSLDAKGMYKAKIDPLTSTYKRIRLPRVIIGRIAVPVPSRPFMALLQRNNPLLVHLPCPSNFYTNHQPKTRD